LKNDPIINLFAIYNLCHQHLLNKQYKAYLAKSRQIAAYALKTSCFHLNVNAHDMSPEFVSDVWINGYYFHDNIEHGGFLRSLAPYKHMVLHTYFF
jgi:hypothetical protein